jgi:RNA polymerase sigma-70 factor (ECF subfamily)
MSALDRASVFVEKREETIAFHHADTRAEVISLYESFRQSLFRYARSFGLYDSDCEEIIQETFLALYRHLLARKPRDHFRAWLFKVARNFVLKRLAEDRAEVDLAWAANALDPGLDPEQRLVEAQLHARLKAVLLALPEQDRECLVLRSEGFRYRDIARIQGRSLGAIAATLKRSLAKISEVYER